MMMVMVHANNFGVSRYNLALYSSLPMEPRISPIISAAMPDFQANPTATEAALARDGITEGIKIYRMRFINDNLYTLANSSILRSVFLSADSIWEYIIGMTIEADMSVESADDLSHNRARITNDATGTARITLTGILIKASR